MRFVAFADLHIHTYKQFDKDGSRLENCLKVLDILFNFCNKNDINTILFAGDLFDQHKQVPTVALNATVDRFEQLFNAYPSIMFYAVSGNHDQASKSLIAGGCSTSLYILNKLFKDRFYLIDDIYNIELSDFTLHGVPYYTFENDFYNVIGGIKVNSNKPNILLTHATVQGYSNIPGNVDPTHEVFKKFSLVLSGDIHKKGRFGENFIMLGSPLHKDFGDLGDIKGFWVFDVSLDKLNDKFISLDKKFPKFVRVFEGDENIDDYKDDYISIIPVIKEAVSQTSSEMSDTFVLSLSEAKLVENYITELGIEDSELLEIGLSLLR